MSKGNRKADWARDEALSRGIDWALRLVLFGVGGAAAVQAWIASSDATTTIIVGSFVFGMMALGLNNADAFWRARSLRGKLIVPGGVLAISEELPSRDRGITLTLQFHNTSLHKIAVVIEECDFSLGDVKARDKRDAYPTKEMYVSPGVPSGFKTGLVPLAKDHHDVLQGTVRIVYRYGRPGATRIYDELEGDLNVRIDEKGNILGDLNRKVASG